MPTQQLQFKVYGGAATISLARPDQRNCLSRQLIREISLAFQDALRERAVRAVIIVGQGNDFCAGLDLREMHETSVAEDAPRQWHEDALLLKELFELMLRFPKPILACTHGAVMGAGVGLAAACDHVIAEIGARFSIPAPKRGIAAGYLAPLVAFRTSPGIAASWMLTSREFSAEEALRTGLVHETVAANTAWARGIQLAAELGQGAPNAIALTKRLINETLGESLFEQLAVGTALTAASQTTESAREGIAAFLEKRPPVW